MKKYVILTVILAVSSCLLGQSPQRMSYQCVVRNNNNLVMNQPVGMRITILQGSPTGTIVYQETYDPKPQTNTNGLVTLEIGTGIPASGDFSLINWASGPFFLKTETDPAAGTNYIVSGTTQLLSVPFALYANTAGNGFSGDYNDLTNTPLLFDGAWVSLTGKPTTVSGYGITDAMTTTHAANSVTTGLISNWNTAYGWGNHAGLYRLISYVPSWNEITNIPSGFADGTDNVDDADNSITNEIQVLSTAGSNLTLSLGGGTVAIPGDNWGLQTIVSDATLTGNGITATPLGIADNGVTTSKILDATIGAADLADNAVGISKLPPGAAADNFLRGDGTWAIPTVGSITETDPTWDGDANLDGDIGRIGDVGIGTVTPTALLHTNGTGTGGGNILFVGEYKTYFPGNPPVEGAGTRMMWYPDQAVFRMGAVSDDRWDAAKLGSFSTAIGYNCVASGSVALSIGSYTTASNTCSVAIGHGAQSTAYAATALGYSTLASGYATTAMGDNTIAQSYVSTAIGQYNVGSGTSNSWEETDPIFEIGIGRSYAARKNAMTVLKNGYTGIGTVIPEAGLHLAGDGWPRSFVYLEAAAGNDAGVRFYESTTPKWHIFNDASIGGLMIQNNATIPAIYCNQSNAYVGIRTSSPTQALHVVGDAYKTSGGTSWATSSDLRLKYIIGNYTKGLNEIADLQPVRFVYKEENPRQLTAGIEQVGFVAQDVQKIFPEAVTEAGDGYLDFNIHAVNVAMVNAVKELNNKVELQKKEIDDLKILVNSLIDKLSAQNNK